MKRLLCVGLSLALVLAFSSPSFADEAAPDETLSADASIDIPAAEDVPPAQEEPPAETEEPPVEEEKPPVEEEEPPVEEAFYEDIISVEAPVSSRVILNPYRMKVQLSGTESTDSVVGEDEVLRNYSGFPVRVSACAVGSVSPGSEAVFVQTPPDAYTAEKAVFMYLEFQSTADAYSVPAWKGVFRDDADQILVNGPGKEDVLVLDAGTADAPGCGMLRLSGQAAPAPSAMWTPSDTVNVTVSFTFTAVGGEAFNSTQDEAPADAADPEPVPAAENSLLG